jgi:hypothetical protein
MVGRRCVSKYQQFHTTRANRPPTMSLHKPAIPLRRPPTLPFRRGEGRGEGSVIPLELTVPMRDGKTVATLNILAAKPSQNHRT